MYGGWAWLNPLNDRLYFPAVFVINGLLAAWFFFLAWKGDDKNTSALI
jgi:hypothetical protein